MEQQIKSITEIDKTENKEHSDISWDDMLPEILAKIFPEFGYPDLYSASLVNKKFNAIANFSLIELGNMVKEAKQQDRNILIASCKSSPKFTQAVIMSAVESKLSDEDLIGIACTSLEHAKIILRSRLIYRSFKIIKNVDKEEKKCEKYKTEKYVTNSLDLDYSTILNSFSHLDLDLDFNGMYSEANLRFPIGIILAIAKKNIDFSKLALKHACNALSGDDLIKIAKLSLEHTAAVFSNSEAVARLNPRHIFTIAKSSQVYLKYVLLKHPEKIDIRTIQKLLNVSKEYEQTINSCLIPTIYRLPKDLVTKRPQASLTALNLLATEKFFTDINPLWVQQKQTAPAIAAKIEHAIRLYQHCFISPRLNKVLIACLIRDSVKFAQVAFAHPNIQLILGQDLYNKVKNYLQNSLSEKQVLENSASSFTK